MSQTQVLVIESNFSDRSQILNEFRKHKLHNSMRFVEDEQEALSHLFFYNKEKDYEGYPQIILLNLSIKGIDFVKKVRNDIRFRSVKIYFMTKKEQSKIIEREFLFQNKVSGLIIKPIYFKAIDSHSYLDAFSLYLDLIKIQQYSL
jgi:hypothetical protein